MPFLAVDALSNTVSPPLELGVRPFSNDAVWMKLEKVCVFSLMLHSAVSRITLAASPSFSAAAKLVSKRDGMVPFGRLRPDILPVNNELSKLPVVPIGWPTKPQTVLGSYLFEADSKSSAKSGSADSKASTKSGLADSKASTKSKSKRKLVLESDDSKNPTNSKRLKSNPDTASASATGGGSAGDAIGAGGVSVSPSKKSKVKPNIRMISSVLNVIRSDCKRTAFVKPDAEDGAGSDDDASGIPTYAVINGYRIRPGVYGTAEDEPGLDAVGLFLCDAFSANTLSFVIRPNSHISAAAAAATATATAGGGGSGGNEDSKSFGIMLWCSQSKARTKEDASTEIEYPLLHEIEQTYVRPLAQQLANALHCPVVPVVEVFSTLPLHSYKAGGKKENEKRPNWVIVHRDRFESLVSPVVRAQLKPLQSAQTNMPADPNSSAGAAAATATVATKK